MKRPIAFRLVLSVGITLVMVLGVGSYVLLQRLEQRVVAEVFDGGDRLAQTLSRSLRYAMLHDDREAVAATIKAVGKQAEMQGIRIFNKDGRVMFTSQEREDRNVVPLTDEACRGCHQGGHPVATLDPRDRTNVYMGEDGARHFQRIEPIYNEPDCSTMPCHVHPARQKVLGVMDISVSLARMDQDLRQYRRSTVAGVAGIIGVIAAVILWLVRRLITGRIRQLVDGMGIISAGNLEHRIPKGQEDELGLLAASFNQMTARLQETRGQLLHSEKLASLGRLSAGIAHEINNPLTGILLITSSIESEMPETDPRKDKLRTVVSETKRAREVIKGLLDFSRQTPPSMQPARVEDVVDRAVRIVRVQVERKGVEIEVAAGPATPEVRMDPAQVQQVFLNLLLNALDAMPSGGRIRVECRGTGPAVEVLVQDQGTGIPPDVLPHIFEPFYTTKEGGKGTGLGLAVSWGIMEQHGGTIVVQSEVGKGTTFTVRIPVSGAAAASRQAAGADARA